MVANVGLVPRICITIIHLSVVSCQEIEIRGFGWIGDGFEGRKAGIRDGATGETGVATGVVARINRDGGGVVGVDSAIRIDEINSIRDGDVAA